MRLPRCAPRSAPVTPATSASPRHRARGSRLKTEGIGLAVMTELPLIIVNSQRGGPSTGLPTKTEQSDLYQALYGRNARLAAAGARCILAVRRLRLRDRGGAHRDPLHDPGDAAHRRLYRQCRRAMESAGHGGYDAVPGRAFRHAAGGGRTGPALCPQWRRRAAVDQARHARPRTSHRRDRKAAGHRQHRLLARSCTRK